MNEKDLFKLIKTSLKTSKKIDLKSASRNIEEWDSLGQLSILTTLDKRFKNKASKLTKLATAETVKDIVSILKKAKLIK
jgi:acyl carrier protein